MSTANSRRYFWPLITLLLGVLLLAVGYFWLSQSTLLAVESIELSGNHILSDEELMAVVGPRLMGNSLLDYSYEEASEALRELPVVKDIEIRRDFPHTLHVEIFEYRPVACYEGSNGCYFLSDDARILSIGGQTDSSLPVLSTGEACDGETGGYLECDDVLTGIEFLISIPVNLHQNFTKVVVKDGMIDATTLSGIDVHFGTIDEYAYKFEVLRQLIARTVTAGEQVVIDVSVPDRPVTRSKSLPAPTTPEADEAVPEEPPAPDTAIEAPIMEDDTGEEDYPPDDTAVGE